VRRRQFLIHVFNHAILIAISIIFMIPILFMLATALMTDAQSLSPRLIPDPFVWSNFKKVFDQIDLVRYTWNTFLYAGLSTVGVVVSCVPVAYAFSRIQWRGRNVVFLLVLSTLMLPSQLTIISMYVIFARDLGWTHIQWVGTLKPLILPSFFGDAFSIFLLRQFFLTVPREYLEAAKVDGCSDLKVLLRIMLPMTRPAIAAVGLFQFFYCWNDYFGPQIWVGENPDAQTLSLALSQFKTLHHVEWNLTMAASLLFMVPVILLFFVAQRVFIEGITLTGVKG
jgi:multiple sugar transport system permease protein